MTTTMAMQVRLMPMVPELAREIERARLEAGLGTEEMLQALREQPEKYYLENYAAADEQTTAA